MRNKKKKDKHFTIFLSQSTQTHGIVSNFHADKRCTNTIPQVLKSNKRQTSLRLRHRHDGPSGKKRPNCMSEKEAGFWAGSVQNLTYGSPKRTRFGFCFVFLPREFFFTRKQSPFSRYIYIYIFLSLFLEITGPETLGRILPDPAIARPCGGLTDPGEVHRKITK